MKLRVLLIWGVFFLVLFIWEGGSLSAKDLGDDALSRRVDPALAGPENLCMVFGSIVGTFSGGGEPDIDVYTWSVKNPNGEVIFARSGGPQYETIEVSFSLPGDYLVELSVRRNADIILNESKNVLVVQGPDLVALPDYLICAGQPTTLTAIDPNSPNFDQYVFTWTDAVGNVVGNTNSISVSQAGYYFYELYYQSADGRQVCNINGTTFAGPPLDFSLAVSSGRVCQNQSVNATTNSRNAGDWYLIRPGSGTRELVGQGFEVTVGGSALSGIGTYTLVFSAVDSNNPDCYSEREINFEVVEGPFFVVEPIQLPANCGTLNGGINITATSSLDSLFVLEADFVRGSVSRGQSFDITGLEPGIYTAVGYVNGCENVLLFPLDPTSAPGASPQIQIGAEACTPTGVSDGSAVVTFPQGPVSGRYRLLGEERGYFSQDTIVNQETLSFELPGGTYLLELEIDGCIYPTEEVIIPNSSRVAYSLPGELMICESLDLTPVTSQDLVFTLTFPDQTQRTLPSGEPFVLTEPGEYELLGESADPAIELCPKIERFEVKASPPFSFDYSVYEEDCYGNQVYQAHIEGFPPAQTSIRWRNENNDIVGRGTIFYAPRPGVYSLLVEPLAKGICPVEPIFFTVEAPIFYTEVNLEATKICPDPGTSVVKMTTNLEIVQTIEWIFFDDAGNRRALPEYRDSDEIIVSVPGNYEAVIYNRIGCEMGRNFIRVENSTLLAEPDVEELYGICERGATNTAINPGSYLEYNWFFEGNLVSTDSVYSPTDIGNYLLEVTTVDGCEFSATFQTYDGCNFEFVYPNAMVLGDPARMFEMHVSEGITSAELFIVNRQGGLVFHEQIQEIPSGQAIFQWDGKSDGKYVIPGTYVVIFIGTNSDFGIEEKTTGSLLVIE